MLAIDLLGFDDATPLGEVDHERVVVGQVRGRDSTHHDHVAVGRHVLIVDAAGARGGRAQTSAPRRAIRCASARGRTGKARHHWAPLGPLFSLARQLAHELAPALHDTAAASLDH